MVLQITSNHLSLFRCLHTASSYFLTHSKWHKVGRLENCEIFNHLQFRPILRVFIECFPEPDTAIHQVIPPTLTRYPIHMREHTAWPGSWGLSRWLNTITALGDDYNLVREMACVHTGPWYEAVSAKEYPGDSGLFFWWAVRDHLTASWWRGDVPTRPYEMLIRMLRVLKREKWFEIFLFHYYMTHIGWETLSRTGHPLPWACLEPSLRLTSPDKLGMELTGFRGDRCGDKV